MTVKKRILFEIDRAGLPHHVSHTHDDVVNGKNRLSQKVSKQVEKIEDNKVEVSLEENKDTTTLLVTEDNEVKVFSEIQETSSLESEEDNEVETTQEVLGSQEEKKETSKSTKNKKSLKKNPNKN
jgi:hypothetical protein